MKADWLSRNKGERKWLLVECLRGRLLAETQAMSLVSKTLAAKSAGLLTEKKD